MSAWRFLAAVLIFAGGAAVGWVLHQPKREAPPPTFDLAADISVIRPQRPDGVSRIFHPHAFYVDGVGTKLAEPPANSDDLWQISLSGGRVQVFATVIHTAGDPPSQR